MGQTASTTQRMLVSQFSPPRKLVRHHGASVFFCSADLRPTGSVFLSVISKCTTACQVRFLGSILILPSAVAIAMTLADCAQTVLLMWKSVTLVCDAAVKLNKFLFADSKLRCVADC